MYSIVDLEATGGKFNEESIIEIAIYKYDGEKVVDQFISLVNPDKEISPYVEKLTGIDDKNLIKDEFKSISLLYKKLKLVDKNIKYLSIGMSNDYNLAINEGGNMIRIGSRIFGER